LKKSKCVLCHPNERDKYSQINGDQWEIKCDTCGKYKITEEAIRKITAKHLPLHIIKGYIRLQSNVKNTITNITAENINNILLDPLIPKSFSEKVNILLLNLEAQSKLLGGNIELNLINDFVYSFSQESSELTYILLGLDNSGFIQYTSGKDNKGDVTILFKGYERIEKIKERSVFSNQCFIAMAFDKDRDSIYDNVINKVVNETGYSPYRIDRDEHSELIPFKIIEEIKKSKFVISDCTKQKGGVYFEAGYAMGRSLPVIWLCEESDFDNRHFDIEQYNFIKYKDEKDLYNKLKTRINAIIN